MKTFFGFLGGINFALTLLCAADGKAWVALLCAGMMWLNLYVSREVDQ